MQRRISAAVRGVDGAGRRGLVLAALALVVVGGACSDNNNSVAPLVATAITPNATTNGQTGTVATPLAQAVGVVVVDQNGAPFPNASVAWTIESGGGSVDSAATFTDANGHATVVWTLGTTAGTDSLKATLTSGASTFITATATAGAAQQLHVTSGGSQTVTAGSTTAPLVLQVQDQFGNPLINTTVTWAVTGGGSLSATSSTTDSTGTTQVTLTTGPSPANYVVTATIGTLSVAFNITAM